MTAHIAGLPFEELLPLAFVYGSGGVWAALRARGRR